MIFVVTEVPFNFIIDNEIYKLYAIYKGKEKITLKDEKQYNCLKFSTELLEGTLFSGGDNLTVWITDDYNKIPIKHCIPNFPVTGPVLAVKQGYGGQVIKVIRKKALHGQLQSHIPPIALIFQ